MSVVADEAEKQKKFFFVIYSKIFKALILKY